MAGQHKKRKAPEAEVSSRKKCHVEQTLSEDESDFIGANETDISSNESSDGETQTSVRPLTPLTPISQANSPKLPSNRKTIPCTFSGCEKTFNRQAKLAQHLNSHTNTRPFVCPHVPCTKAFFRSSHLKHHVKSAHSDRRDYVCQWERCGKSFVTSTRLKRHQDLHVKRQQFACTYAGCGQEFRKHNTLQKHIAIVHEGKKKPFVCHQQDHNGTPCGASFDIEGNLRNHVNSVHSGRTYHCTICTADDVSFPTLPALQAHIKAQHPPTCPECGSTFSSNDTLKDHIEAKHSNIDLKLRKKFACVESGCGRSFTSKSNLNTHVRDAHEEAKSFVCGMVDPRTLADIEDWDGSDACGRALSSKYNLIGHIRTVHLGLSRLKRQGKAEKRQEKADEKPDLDHMALMRLTGIGYEDGRQIECSIPGCAHRFQREYDLQRHLHSHHHLEASDNDGHQGSMNQISPQPRPFSTSIDTQLEHQYPDFDDYFDLLEEQAAAGGAFWLGGHEEEEEEEEEDNTKRTSHRSRPWDTDDFVEADGLAGDHTVMDGGSIALDPRLTKI